MNFSQPPHYKHFGGKNIPMYFLFDSMWTKLANSWMSSYMKYKLCDHPMVWFHSLIFISVVT